MPNEAAPGKPEYGRLSYDALGAPLHHAAKELEKLDLSFIDWDRLMRAAGRC